MKTAAVVLAFMLAGIILPCVGCGAKTPPIVAPTIVKVVETVEIKVPVPVARIPPAALLTPVTGPLPTFVPPSDPKAAVALTSDEIQILFAWLEKVKARLTAWQVWAASKD